MKKILIATALIAIFPSISMAKYSPAAYADTENLPVADGGINIVPLAKMHSTRQGLVKAPVLEIIKQVKEKGFYESPAPEAQTLMNMRNMRVLRPGSDKPEDTELKSTVKDVGLAFEFKGVPISKNNVVGFAAAGLYNNGWNGITEVFTDNDLGTCQYTLYNIKLSHGSENIAQEIVRYDVNGKITTLYVKGNAQYGYMYQIHWADNKAINEIMCANSYYDKAKTEKLIELAKRTDKVVVIK